MAVPQEIWTFPKGLLSSSTQEPRVKSQKQGALLALCLQETDLCLDGEEFGSGIKISQFSWPETRKAQFLLIKQKSFNNRNCIFIEKQIGLIFVVSFYINPN